MATRIATDDLRKANLPPSADAYEAKLPDDLKLPGGKTYTFDKNDPTLIAARNMAHAKGWSQQDFSEALGIFAGHIVAQEAALAERAQAELAKAGANAPQRVDAVHRLIDAYVGPADAAPIKASLVTDAQLRFFEKVFQQINSQGTSSFTQSHRAAPDTGIPGFESMSFEQKRYAQDQRAAQRRSA